MQAVVTGEIGKRRVVNHKGVVCAGSGERLPYEAVGMLYLAAEGIIAFQVSAFITFIDAAQRTQNIARDDLGVGSGVPYMGFYAGGVVVLLPVFRMPMAVGIVVNQIHALRHVKELQVRGVVCQLICPCLFKAYIADAEIGFTAGKVYKLLRRRVVGFRTCTFGNHADYCEPVAGNGFGEVSQRLERNGNDGFAVGFVALAAFGLAGSYEYGCEQ